jgi:hypothetical protein
MRPELSTLLAELQKSRALLGAEELRQRRPGHAPTGLETLDTLLGGGLPTGKIVELQGRPGAGATAVAIRLLARFSSLGHSVALVDRPDAFEPRSAQEAGVELQRLLWCRPVRFDDTARATDALLASGAFPLVVLDLAAPRRAAAPRSLAPALLLALDQPVPAPRRRPDAPWSEAHWVRLARRAEAARATLLVLAGSEAGAASASSATLEAVRGLARFVGQGPGRTFEGLEVSLRLVRNKLGLPPGLAQVVLEAPRHFPEPAPEQTPALVPRARRRR